MARAKTFCCVSLGILALMLAFAVGAQYSQGAAEPVVLGTLVAVETGTLDHGQTIPLPTYPDGSVATEAECKWIVGTEIVPVESESGLAWGAFFGQFWCRAPGRVVDCLAPDQGRGGYFHGRANYMIIATRLVLGPTATESSTWGRVKARFAGD